MKRLTYKQVGVDIERADRFLKRIRPLVKGTRRNEVLGTIGAFSGFFRPRLKSLKDPVLVSSTDGVGTKLLVANLLGKYDTVGIDLVAMCVNDVVVMGAEPLFFLDYLAAGKIDPERLYELTKGIVKGCQLAGCALIGGETAELPGLYEKEKFDLAGFCVGLIDRRQIIDGSKVKEGDRVIGLESSGLHSNGFSLVRKVFKLETRNQKPDTKLLRKLLRPTRIYVKPILKIIKEISIKAMAHITGGGFYDNIPRVLPRGLGVKIKRVSWPIPPIFRLIQSKGNVEDREMFRTFNMGIGMVLVADKKNIDKIKSGLSKFKLRSWLIGEVVRGKKEVEII